MRGLTAKRLKRQPSNQNALNRKLARKTMNLKKRFNRTVKRLPLASLLPLVHAGRHSFSHCLRHWRLGSAQAQWKSFTYLKALVQPVQNGQGTLAICTRKAKLAESFGSTQSLGLRQGVKNT